MDRESGTGTAGKNNSIVGGIQKAIAAASDGNKSSWGTTLTSIMLVAFSVGLWIFLSRTSWPPELYVSLSLASFMVGCLAGFLFTSYGEEAATVGKVKDWFIGGLAGLTIAKFSALKFLLLTFAGGAGPQPYALSVAVSITFATLGFFAMFFQRELILNVLLAESRDKRGRVEGTKLAGIITHQLLAALPPSLLSGIDNIDETIARSHKPEAERLRKLLDSEGVKKFLIEAEQSCVNGGLDWDVVSKAAILHYYLVYFAGADEKDAQEVKAIEWITRALIMNPGHADLTAKYADVLAISGDYHQAIDTLERLDKSPEAPAYIRQWLGYFLLQVEERQDDVIRYSEEYLKRYPNVTECYFNSARAYAQKYALAQRIVDKEPTDANKVTSANLRRLTLDKIREALDAEPASEEADSKKWVSDNIDFKCLNEDVEFQTLINISKNGAV
jgi:tetratricopeptide (TPR) repeat protein